MRDKDTMMQIIKQVGIDNNVLAIAINGSRALDKRENVVIDAFQDYDVVYILNDKDMKKCINKDAWLKPFGEILIKQLPMTFNQEKIDYTMPFNILMLFKDHVRIDLSLVPLSKIEQWYQNDPVAKVIYDPNEILKFDFINDEAYYYTNKPTQKEFYECCNEFWWVSTYVVKGIVRKQFMYAANHYYNVCLQEFLKLLSWRIGCSHNYKVNFGKDFKYLCKYTTTAMKNDILEFQNNSSFDHLNRNIIRMQNIFDEVARNYAELEKLDYDCKEALNVKAYTNSLIGRSNFM